MARWMGWFVAASLMSACLILGLAGCNRHSPQPGQSSGATEPAAGGSDYARYRDDALAFVRARGPVEIQTDLSPESPGNTRARYRLRAAAQNDKLVVVTDDKQAEIDFGVWFGEEVEVVDNVTQAVLRRPGLPGIRHDAQPQASTQTDMILWHLLISVAGTARLDRELGDRPACELNLADSKRLLAYLFPDDISAEALFARVTTTRVEKWTREGWVRMDWLVGRQTFFDARWRPSGKEEMDTAIRRFRPDPGATPKLPSPPLKEVLDYLARHGLPEAASAEMWRTDPQVGIRKFAPTDAAATQPGQRRISSVFMHQGIGMSVDIMEMAPYTGAEAGAYASFRKAAAMPKGYIILEADYGGSPRPEGFIIILTGQSWGLYAFADGEDESMAARLRDLLVDYIREYEKNAPR